MNDEQLKALKEAARAATPQDIESAESVERHEGGYIECPVCSGEGRVEIEADYCNYDGKAIGVQFYGIGPEHGAAETYFRAASPALILSLIERLERAESSLAASASAEPVAWIRMDHLRQAQQAPFMCRVEPAFRSGLDLAPIYLAPRPIEAPAQAVALSAEQERKRFDAWWNDRFGYVSRSMAWDGWQARAALSAPASMSAEPQTDAEALAEAWQSSLDYMREHKQAASMSAENRPAQDDVRDAQRYRWLKMESPPYPQRQLMLSTPWGQWDSTIDAAIASQSAKEPL